MKRKGDFDEAHDALERMRRAFERGTGCHLTASMINCLSVTVIGSMWNEDDPRDGVEDADREYVDSIERRLYR